MKGRLNVELEQQQKQQEVVMMTEPDDEVNAGLAARRRNEPDEFISLVVAEFHLCCRLLNFKPFGLLQIVAAIAHQHLLYWSSEVSWR